MMIWVVLILFVLTFMWSPKWEKYEEMGVYGTKKVLDINAPGDVTVLPGVPAWSNTDSVESPSLEETQRFRILGNEAAHLLQWDNQYQMLPTHRVHVS
jgi:hypothetical protein